MLAPFPKLHARRTPRRRICFPLIAQWHQAFHALPIAAALSRRAGYEVHVAVTTVAQRASAEAMVTSLGGRGVVFHTMWPAGLPFAANPPKVLMLAGIAVGLRNFDAIVVPERTSLLLKRLGVTRPLMIHTDHGAGDRAVGYEPRIRQFDFVLLAGAKQEERMRRAGLIEPGKYAIVGYPKFEAVAATPPGQPALFDRQRPTVLYNPHFRRDLGSWDRLGREVLARFAAQDRYNLIFAPHVRLADTLGARLERDVAPYRSAPNIHIDLGGPRCCDMTYTEAADVYVGDVSSQVYEFIRRPRPCLFLNPHGRDWAGDENYAHWAFGPVASAVDRIVAAVDDARRTHRDYAPAQVEAFRRTFSLDGSACSDRAADAIEGLLRGSAVSSCSPLGELSAAAG